MAGPVRRAQWHQGMVSALPWRGTVLAVARSDAVVQVDRHGRVWAAARGGVHVFGADGSPLGFIETGFATNLALTPQHVYITTRHSVLRLRLVG